METCWLAIGIVCAGCYVPGGEDAGVETDAAPVTGDAGAAPHALIAACDTTVPIGDADAGTAQTYYFAMFRVPGLDPHAYPVVLATTCGWAWTQQTAIVSPAALAAPADQRCYSNVNVTITPGLVSVFCGLDGNHAATARIKILD